jgi:hypothetical protein
MIILHQLHWILLRTSGHERSEVTQARHVLNIHGRSIRCWTTTCAYTIVFAQEVASTRPGRMRKCLSSYGHGRTERYCCPHGPSPSGQMPVDSVVAQRRIEHWCIYAYGNTTHHRSSRTTNPAVPEVLIADTRLCRFIPRLPRICRCSTYGNARKRKHHACQRDAQVRQAQVGPHVVYSSLTMQSNHGCTICAFLRTWLDALFCYSARGLCGILASVLYD